MARRGNHGDASTRTRNPRGQVFGDVRWVNYNLTDAHKAELEKMIKAGPEKLEAEFQSALQDGYKVSVGWDDYAECFSCTMYTREPGHVNEGMMLSSRARTWYKAVLMTVYKHAVVFEGHWVPTAADDRDFEG